MIARVVIGFLGLLFAVLAAVEFRFATDGRYSGDTVIAALIIAVPGILGLTAAAMSQRTRGWWILVLATGVLMIGVLVLLVTAISQVSEN